MNKYANNSTLALKLSLKMIMKKCPDYPLGKTDQIIKELRRRLTYNEFIKLISIL